MSVAVPAQAQVADAPGLAPAPTQAAPAQSTPTDTASPDGQTPDIVVTAQNRAQRVQDVPIAITVVDAERVRDFGVNDFTTVSRVAPQLQVTSDTQYTRVAVRGVGTNSNTEAQDQSVAVNIDGEYINRGEVLNASLFDLDRIEVLRGPQGTLYGRNATGGAVNFITRKPGDRFGINATASYGNFNAVNIEGGVDVPFGFGAIRLSGIYADRDGYNYHPNIDARSGDAHTLGGRASVRLEPIDGLRIDSAYEHVFNRFIPAAQAFANLNSAGNTPGAGCTQNGFVDIAPLVPGDQCAAQNTNFLRNVDRNAYNAPVTGLGILRMTTDVVRGRIAYDFGPATLTYTGGYRATTGPIGNITLQPNYRTYVFDTRIKTQSHELRLNGETGGFVWQTGGFLFKEKQENNGAGLFSPFVGPNGSFINYFRRPYVDAKSWAVFGQTDIPLFDKFTAVLGARYTDDSRSALYENLGFQFNSGPARITRPATAAETLNLGSDNSKFTWLAGLNYQPDRDTLLYVKASTGFKAGGFDSVGTYKPETNTAYEGGAKLNFGPSSRNVFNLSGFYYDYRDLQVDVLLNTTVGGQTFNAGKATIWGIEAETRINLDSNNVFSGSVSYLNAKYDTLLASYPAVGGTVGDLDTNPATITQPNLAGNTPPQAPRFTITTGYDHIFDLGFGSLTASVYSRFKSSYFLDIFNFRDSEQKAFTQTDLSLKYQPIGKNWDIQAFVRNLEDTRELTFASFISAGPDNVYNWQFGAPRTYGVRVGVNF